MRWAVVAMAAISTVLVSTSAFAQQAGQLISADPVGDAPAGMQAWRISYWTTTGKSAPIRATGGDRSFRHLPLLPTVAGSPKRRGLPSRSPM